MHRLTLLEVVIRRWINKEIKDCSEKNQKGMVKRQMTGTNEYDKEYS